MSNGVSAHRGNMSVYPENTMPAFESAIALGCDYIELDIQFTRDGQIAVTHDADAVRVAGQHALIAHTDYKNLLNLNFGKTFQLANNQTGTHLKLPLLSEVLQLAKGSNTKISIQPKCYGIVKAAWDLAKSMGMQNNIGFNDTNCEYLIEARRLSEEVELFWDRPPGTDFETDLFIAGQYQFNTLMYEWQGITQEKINTVKAAGFQFGACVINDEAAMRKYLDMGVDRFYTDYPELLLQLKMES